ncbi:MAG: dihydrolipoyl dehydrogenase [Bacillota bacterium]|nr:dihydrolipoyl dehydrogenase [Bacillota bacterium]
MDKDIIIIGGGPGGYTAAIRAAQLGAKVAVIEKDELGGTCLNRGCIPTKALYRTAEILNTLKSVDQFGITVDNYKIDVDSIQKRKLGIVEQLVTGIRQLLKANNVEVVAGTAVLKGKNTVEVCESGGNTLCITAANIIIATGSKAVLPPIPGSDLEGIWLSDDILNFTDIPDSLAVIGGGVIGMEFAAIFNALGSKVTVLEYMPAILPMVDADLTKRLTAAVKRKGIDINTSTKVKGIEPSAERYTLCCEGKKGEMTVPAQKVLIAVGRAPVTEGLNLTDVGVEYDRKGIKVDENYCTNIEGIYAIGDVNGEILLAHAAAHQGIRAAEHIMGTLQDDHSDKKVPIPSCIFVFPEIASVGLTEEQAKEQGLNYKVSKFLFGANGKALTLGEPEGMVKVISKASAENEGDEVKETIIGVHIMGPHASDIIHEGVLAVNSELELEAVINTVHAHPTLSEAFSEAVMGLKGQAIHMVNRL